MRKVASILLLGILLFNWCGYQLLTSYLECHADIQLEARLNDNKYAESDLISFKVPAGHLSAYTNSTQFIRTSGKIEVGGIQYSYVKRRLYNDSIEMLCIPNRMVMQIKKGNNEFFKLVNGLQHPGQGKKPVANKNFSGNYCTVQDLFRLGDPYYTLSRRLLSRSTTIPSNLSPAVERPPDKTA
jgi:hypothetical protein